MANNFSGDSNCVALYRFESGALTTDSKGGNTLTDVNTVGEDTVDYKEGACCADFELNNNEHFYVSDANLDAGFPFKNGDTNRVISVCGWVKLESSPNYAGNFVNKFDTSGKFNFQINFCDGNNFRLYTSVGYNNGGSWNQYTHQTILSLNTWYHAGVVIDGQNNNIKIRLSLADGTKVGTDIDTALLNSPSNGEDRELTIGSRRDTSSFPFDGRMDEVVIFKDALTFAEIDQIRAGTYGAAAATTVTATLQSLLVTQLAATTTYDYALSASLQTLSITQPSSTTLYDYALATSLQRLLIAQGASSVTLGVDIAAALQTLVMSQKSSSCSYDYKLTAALQTLAMSQYSVTCALDYAFAAALQRLNLTQYQPTFTYDYATAAALQTLAVSQNSSIIDIQEVFAAALQTLAMTQYTPIITYDALLPVNLQSLLVSPQASTILYDYLLTGLTTQGLAIDINSVDVIMAKVMQTINALLNNFDFTASAKPNFLFNSNVKPFSFKSKQGNPFTFKRLIKN